MAQLRAAAAREPRSEQPEPAVGGEQREELADALAAAVERLRARAEASPTEPAEELIYASARSPAEPTEHAAVPTIRRSSHKHSMSFLTRLQIRRKQRRVRRSAAAEPPKIPSQ
jgi:hypothetical protein